MYLVIIINDNVETVINAASTDINAPHITGTVKQGINSIDSFSFTILPKNQGFNLIKPMKTLVKVLNSKTNKYEFIGRVLKPSGNMDSSGMTSKTYVCESELAFLIDSTQVYGEYHNITPEQYLKIMLDRHNSNREDHKKFKLGNVTVKDNNDSLYKNIAYDSTWKNINDDLIDRYGGELQIRYVGDEKYLDYLTEIGEVKETEIRLGRNIKDITNDIDPTSYITRLYPLGNKLKTTDAEGNEVDSEERLTIASVNNGLDYIDDEEAIAQFGIIEGFVTWDDVTDAANLLKKGQSYISSQRIVISNKITALDLSLIGLDIDSFEVGNYYPLKHELLDIDYNVRIIEKSIDINNPQNASITLGDKQKDIKQYQLDIKKQAQKTVNLEKQISGQNAKLNNMNDAIVETNKSVDAISESVETVGNEVVNLGTSTSETINNMLESISLLSESVSSINATLESVNKSISNINTNIATINKNISTMQTDISKLDEKVNLIDTSVVDIDGRINAIDTTIASIDERVKALEGGA